MTTAAPTATTRPEPSRRFSVAPMMDWTDRHCRFFLRQLSSHALLYTEMVTTGAILHGDAARFLRHDECEHPLALQLGGSNPADLAAAAKMAEAAGYDEVNLNVGCPSDRVQNNMIGACLMGHPALVAECVKAMRDAVSIPVTVKHRIGINGRDSYEELCDFVGQVRDAGCRSFTVHARIAILEACRPRKTAKSHRCATTSPRSSSATSRNWKSSSTAASRPWKNAASTCWCSMA